MGQKVNPIGLRLGKQKKWESNWFNDFKDYDQFLQKNFLIKEYIESLFQYNFNKNHIIVKASLIKAEENKLYYVIFFYRLRSKLVSNKWLKQDLSVKYGIKNSKFNKNFYFINQIKKDKSLLKLNFNYIKFLKAKTQLNIINDYFLKSSLIENLNIILYIIKSNLDHKDLIKVNIKKKLVLEIKNLLNSLSLFLVLALKQKNKENIQLFVNLIRNLKSLKQLVYFNSFLNYEPFLRNDTFLKLIFSFIFNFKTKKALLKNLINKEFAHEQNILARLIYLNKKEKAYDFLNNLPIEKRKEVLALFLKLIWINQKELVRKNSNLISKKDDFDALHLILNEYTKHFSIRQNYLEAKTSLQLSHLANSNVQLLYLNCLSFLKYQALLNDTNVNRLLTLEKNLTRFYRARFKLSLIQQFIYGGYISVYFKNPDLLGKIIVEGLETLPKFRKHGQYFKFLNDMINALINSQKEIIGFRIKLKGRFNKWRRTKSVYINRGRLPLRIHDSKISYSSSYGCIRRGLFGVKIWICYDKHFSNKLESDLKNYLLYSKNKQIGKNVT